MTTIITTLNELSATWAPAVWTASWHGGLALLLVLFLSRAVRRIPAHLLCWLWRLAFLKLLIAGLWIVPIELRWLPPENPITSAVVTAEPPLPITSERPAIAPPSTVVPSVAPAPSTPQLSGASWLFVAWIVGTFFGLANLTGRWIQVRRLVSGLARNTDEPINEAVVRYCRQMRIRRPPELRVSDESVIPFLVGVVRPVIILPSVVLRSCSDAERDAALIHELAHIRRRDLLWNWLPALAEAVFFFHPLVWLARRQWRLSQEIAADELAVAESQADVAEYAKSLVELVAKCPVVTIRPHLAISMSQAYSHLKRRVIAMQTFQPQTASRRVAVATAVLVIGILGIVPWKLAAQESAVAPVSNESAAGEPLSPRIKRIGDQEIDASVVPDSDKTEGRTDLPDAASTPPNSGSEDTSRTITIRVVDQSGHPVQGAKVFRNHVYLPNGTKLPKDTNVYNLDGTDRPKIENKENWTNADGKAVVELSGESVDLRLWATKEKFIPLHAMWAYQFQSDGHRIPKEFTFQLQPGTVIGGIVKDTRGEPIEGVKVAVKDRTATQFHSPDPKQPGIRPVRSDSLTEGSDVVTDANGRWKVENVPPDELLTFPYDPLYARAGPKIALRLSHPDYITVEEWGALQTGQFVTHQELRDQTATIVLKRIAR